MNLQSYTLIKDISSEVLTMLSEGGPGSGNWGHKGRPGMRGGSLPTKGTSIMKSLIKSEKGGIRIPKVSSKLWRAARTARNIEVVASGSPMKMLKRAINILLGRSIVSRIYR